MTIPSSKVKSLCTSSEVALVRASRKGEIERLSHSQVKRFALRARKLFDKWRGLGRGQSRARSRHGVGDLDANTQLKAQIFREALDGFQVRLTELETAPAAQKSRSDSKRVRSAQHRATRAALRKDMTAIEDLLNAQVHRKQKRTTEASTTATSQHKPVPAERRRMKAAPNAAREKIASPKKRDTNVALVGSFEQRDVIKTQQSRAVRTGKIARVHGHISSRGRRSQAGRDAKS